MDIWEEHQTWLQILNDHLTFFQDRLSSTERDALDRIRGLKLDGEKMLSLAKTKNEEIRAFTQDALEFANLVGELKKDFLNWKLNTDFKLSLDPTFINHMLNELDDYIDLLVGYLEVGEVPQKDILHYHYLWLLDETGHLNAVKEELDGLEKKLKKEAKKQKKAAHELFMKALEFIGYLRAADNFPALVKLNHDAVLETRAYLALIQELSNLVNQNMVLGTLTPLMLDHMYREQVYYLTKIGAQV